MRGLGVLRQSGLPVGKPTSGSLNPVNVLERRF
jgi:hypothetical protein